MKLLRIAVLDFTPVPPEDWQRGWRFEVGPVTVTARATTGPRVFASAELEFNEPLVIDNDGLIEIPTSAVRKAQHAIEVAANTIAVVGRLRRSISSPTPCLAFSPTTDEERASLGRARAIRSRRGAVESARFSVNLPSVAVLSDRLDGLALMAEALSHQHETGRFHDLQRVFERAFRKKTGGLVRPLSEFLRGTPHGFTEGEVKVWTTTLRNPATHADSCSEPALEADVSTPHTTTSQRRSRARPIASCSRLAWPVKRVAWMHSRRR